jgi:hypothetical protein
VRLQDVRDAVRAQADLDSEDLPDPVLDAFIREGFDRTFSLEQRWPFFENTWSLVTPGGTQQVPLPPTPKIAHVLHMRNTLNGSRVIHISQQLAEDNFIGSLAIAEPQFFSIWGDTITFWPMPPSDPRTYAIRGYRQPTWTGVALDELDGDERLHTPMIHYAVALAYAQLEDPELEASYMQRWSAGVDTIRRTLMRPRSNEPLILNGGLTVPNPRSPYYWNIG